MKTPSQEIDDIIKKADKWKGDMLKELRAVILKTDSKIVEEIKWKMPSRPEGVAVWSNNGIICNADILKNAVRLTFHKGIDIKDPKKLFNTRLDSKTVRAIDYTEGATINEAGLKQLVKEAIKLNTKS